jgi:RNA polymerase sigma-70 factor (ECF subfamily)
VDQKDHTTEFIDLVEPYMDQLYRVAFRYTTSKDRAEDLVQTTLTKLFPKTDELLKLEKPGPWLIRVMHRQFIDDLRRYQRSPVSLIGDIRQNGDEEGASADICENAISSDAGPEEATMMAQKRAKLQAAWVKLSTNHRIVLSLHDIEGYTLIELAESLETPIGTLKSRLTRARARLRGILLEPF